jgi:hypothetical protein
MKSALFVQANVAVNTKLTSKVPFLKKIWSKRAISVWYDGKNFPLLPPVANISGKKILGALFNTLEAGAPPPPIF